MLTLDAPAIVEHS